MDNEYSSDDDPEYVHDDRIPYNHMVVSEDGTIELHYNDLVSNDVPWRCNPCNLFCGRQEGAFLFGPSYLQGLRPPQLWGDPVHHVRPHGWAAVR